MITIRRAAERGHSTLGWLDSWHSFSFAGYHDPAHMGVSNLRVINDDRVAPGGGFGSHPHRDMEIVTYVVEGELEHRDSMGNGSVIGPGDVQRMSAGTGVMHSEFNHSDSAPVRFLQIWLEPSSRGVEPGYQQKHFPLAERESKLVLLVSPDGRDGSIGATQDAFLYGGLLEAAQKLALSLEDDKPAYLHLVRGEMELNGNRLGEGDAATLQGESHIELVGIKGAEFLLFRLPQPERNAGSI